MEQQEYFMRMQMLGQEAEKIEQQIQTIDQQIAELASVRESIEAIKQGKQKEVLANLGKGIFTRAEIKEDGLLVNVGKEIILKKTSQETIDIIETQTQRLLVGKQQLIGRIQELQESMQNILIEVQRSGADLNSHSHEHGSSCGHDDCECEEPCEDCECEKKGKKK